MPNLTSTELTIAAAGERVREALDLAGWPGRRAVWLLSHGQFSMADLADALLDHQAGAQLDIITWNLGPKELDRLVGYFRNGVVAECRLLMDRSFGTRSGGGSLVFPRLQEAQEAGALDFRLADVHSKIFLLAAGGQQFVAGGTSNWNLARRLEDVRLEANRRLHEQFSAAFDRIWKASRRDRTARQAELSSALKPMTRRRGRAAAPLDVA